MGLRPNLAQKPSTSLKLLLTAVNAAIYAGIGALWTLFPLLIFGVRFWPQVFAPAVFAVLFGPWVGGVGAGIGIFIADVLYGHHDALLSLLVGVPSNFVGFYIVGWLSNHDFKNITRRLLVFSTILIQPIYAVALVYGFYLLLGLSGLQSSSTYLGLVGLIVVVAVLGLMFLKNKWVEFEAAASIGLGIGTAIIGVGIVVYSAIFGLPVAVGLGTKPLGNAFMYIVAASNYFTEIPFMVILTPPIAAACRKAFPSLQIMNKQQTKT
ncbi:MAG TPA: hypothetical protein VLV31_06360 [Candidatus Acidoferrales bacterium]|nr:hypothetical protein [Candidatus Acidoferrales bacterium]